MISFFKLEIQQLFHFEENDFDELWRFFPCFIFLTSKDSSTTISLDLKKKPELRALLTAPSKTVRELSEL